MAAKVDPDSPSTVTSIDENTENLCDNPTRDTLADGLIGLFKPIVDQLDESVRATRFTQMELKKQLDTLTMKLKSIENAQQTPVVLEDYVKKLINVKHKVTVVFNVLQGAQDRLNRIYQLIEREKLKRKSLLDSELITSTSYLNRHQSATSLSTISPQSPPTSPQSPTSPNS